jgi:hypothetical protein
LIGLENSVEGARLVLLRSNPAVVFISVDGVTIYMSVVSVRE